MVISVIYHKIKLLGLQVAMRLRGPVEYKWSWAAIQAPLIIAASYWWYVPAVPGIAVAFLALVAVAMALRAEENWSRTERLFWLGLAICLMVVEIRAIKGDRERQDAVEAQNRRNENARFEGILKDNREKFQATIAEVGRTFDKTEQAADTARDAVNNITGGKTYCYAEAAPHGTNFWFFVIAIGAHPLHEIHAELIDEDEVRESKEPVSPLSVGSNYQIPFLWRSAYWLTQIPIGPSEKREFNIRFTSINGVWYEALKLRRVNGRWEHAVRIYKEARLKPMNEMRSAHPDMVSPGYPRVNGKVDWDDGLMQHPPRVQ